jgi:acetolactate synthase regulatory subunit
VNTLKLQIRMKHSEGALMRVLSVTRRRRFEVLHLIAVATEDGAYLKVQMTVQAERTAHALVGQLSKLEEVFEVEILEPSNTPCGAAVRPPSEPDGFPPIALD